MTRRRVQQDTCGHRGLRTDPLYRIRNILRSGADKLTDRQWSRLDTAISADERHEEVFIAWACYQKIRDAYQQPNLNAGLRIARQIVDTFPTCPIPEIARLGKTLKQWRREYLGYFTTNRSSNGLFLLAVGVGGFEGSGGEEHSESVVGEVGESSSDSAV